MSNLHTPSRRVFTGWVAAAAITGLATQAHAGRKRGGADPMDRIPGHYSVRKFTSFSREEVYRIDHAARLGRRITIGDYTPSQSRKILRKALADWPSTRQALLR